MWRYEFDDYGGYDCMYAAYIIYDKSDERRLCVDTHDFATFDYTDPHKPLPEAEAMAKFIVDRLNAPDGLS